MKKVLDTLKVNPGVEKLNLSFLQIESLDDIVFELFQFKNSSFLILVEIEFASFHLICHF